jgi:hypothetical protein
MKNLRNTVLALLLCSAPAWAHEDHGQLTPALSQKIVAEQSQAELLFMVETGRPIDGKVLDGNWNKAKPPQLYRKGTGYFIFVFTHPKTAKNLYILMSDTGEFFAANFSGTFEAIE